MAVNLVQLPIFKKAVPLFLRKIKKGSLTKEGYLVINLNVTADRYFNLDPH